MNKLISAGFSRLKRDKVFLILEFVMLAYAVAYMLNGCRQAASDTMSGYHYTLEKYYFQYALTIGLFSAVFTSLFLGTEYNDGTIRNKLIIGHTRTRIYLSSLAVCISATLLIMLTWLIGGLIGIPGLGLWNMGNQLYVYLLISVLFTAALSAVFTFIGMLCPNKAFSAVASILLFFGMLFLASVIYNALSQPELANNIIMTTEGIQMGDPAPNPDYISGTTREIYQFILDVLPTGQGLQAFDLSIAHPLRMIISSLCITVGVTVCGLRIFDKKNIR